MSKERAVNHERHVAKAIVLPTSLVNRISNKALARYSFEEAVQLLLHQALREIEKEGVAHE